MRIQSLFYSSAAVLLAAALVHTVQAAKKPSNSVLLSNVQSLTLRKDQKTSHRRVSAIPQLKCIGGDAKGLYEVEVMRCKNQGSDYDDDKYYPTPLSSREFAISLKPTASGKSLLLIEMMTIVSNGHAQHHYHLSSS